MRKFVVEKCMKSFYEIESEKGLKRDKITLSEYFEIGYNIQEAVRAYNAGKEYKIETISKSVSNWFVRRGAAVIQKGIGWEISF